MKEKNEQQPLRSGVLLDCAAWHQDQSDTYANLMALTHARGDRHLGDVYAEMSQMHQHFADSLREQEAV